MRFSLRRRIIVASISAVLLLNVVTTTYLHAALEKTLLADAEAFLRAKAHTLASVAETNRGDVSLLRSESEWQPSGSQYSHVYTRIIDNRGQVTVETPGRRWQWPDATTTPNELLTPVTASDGEPFLMLSTHIRGATVQLAIDLSRQYDTLRSQRWILLVLAALSISSLTLLAVAMSRLATQPIHRLVEDTRALRSGATTTLEVESYPSELQPLVSALRDLHAKLHEQIQTLSRFSESVAHELRNPINILTGEAELALSRPRSLDDYQDTLRSALEEYRDLSQLIDSLLFVARAENHAETIRRVSVDIHTLASEVLDFYEPLAEERKVTTKNDIQPGTRIWADPLLAKRALSNLVVNAIQHGSSPGELRIDAALTDVATHVHVENRGPTLAPEQVAKLFDRFYRVDPSRSGGDGSGLGLPIVKGIMTLHDGQVWAEPRDDGMKLALSFPSPTTAAAD